MEDKRPSLFYATTAHQDEDDLYSILAQPAEQGGNTWNYSDDIKNEGLKHLPARNTLFINSNIALTDGNSNKISESNTIPNLYDALEEMAHRIKTIEDTTDEPSTADKRLYIEESNHVVGSDGIERASALTILPGTNNSESPSNASIEDTHIKTFTIATPEKEASITLTDKIDEENSNLKLHAETITVDGIVEKGIHITSGEQTQLIINNDDVVMDGKNVVIGGENIVFNIPSGDKDEENPTAISLRAIIEAIRELNRRTAFIDSSLGIKQAADYFDVIDEDLTEDGVYANKDDDGLPAATNSLYNSNVVEYHSAGQDCTCKQESGETLQDIEHNAKITQEVHPETGKPVIKTMQGDEMMNTQGAAPLDAIERSLNEDISLISPENAEIRNRGCPYLML